MIEFQTRKRIKEKKFLMFHATGCSIVGLIVRTWINTCNGTTVIEFFIM